MKIVGKVGLKILEAAIEGLVKGVLNLMGPEKLNMFIENDWNILESIFYGLCRSPSEVYKNMSPEEVSKTERIRHNLARTVLPIIGMAQKVARSFPPEAVESKVTAEWLMRRGREKFPELIEIVESHGDRGRAWLDRQAKQICDYLTGKIVYHPVKLKFVSREEMIIEIQRIKKHGSPS